jgi:site-specific DNA-methyltransferase (adenine-specific)
MTTGWKNRLYFGDNLEILRKEIASESVDLVYLDPPFNSNATYNVLFAEKSGKKSAAQIAAFDDTWQWGLESEASYHETVTAGGKLADLLQAFRGFLGQNDMMAYLVMMAARLKELHRVLKPTGSLYLHCDPTASHYLKLLMDAVVGPANFRNEVIWKRTAAHSAAERWGDVHDTLLFYTKGNEYIWNDVLLPHSEEYAARYKRQDPDGRRWTDDNLTGPGIRHGDSGAMWRGLDPTARGVHWKVNAKTVEDIVGPEIAKQRSTTEKLDLLDAHGRLVWTRKQIGDRESFPRFKRYLSEGGKVQDVITDIPPINSQAQERLGYPTQKPEALLERIIRASSNEGDLVLDPFCGCGTTIAVAERLHRRWIGIDVTHLAITLMRHRLQNAFRTNLSPYVVEGVPKDVDSAQLLAMQDRYKFEWWALGLVDARPAHDKRKGGDTGFDGVIYFFDDESGIAKKIVVQVKSGSVAVNQIRDLKAVRDREKAGIAAFITLQEPTAGMKAEAASAGFYEPEHFPGQRVPRVQILTIAELLEGTQVLYPRVAPGETFARAPRQKKERGTKQASLKL